MRKPLLALALSAFGIGTSEFIIMGLLPDLSRDLHVSIPKAGLLVSGYALSVTIGSPVVALLLSQMDRKRALLILMGIFLLGNALCAAAPTYPLLLGARVLTALCHGAFFGIGSIVATNVVPRGERAQAIALMFSGLTLANVLGVPAGTALGQAFGWRFAFSALLPIGFAAALGLLRLVPHQPAEPIHLRHEFHAITRPQVQLVLLLSTLSSVSLFCVLTYIAPILERVTHLTPHAVTWVLVVFGVGITGGNLLGGRLADWKQMPVILGGIGLLIAIFLAMPWAEPSALPAIGTVFVWGFVQFAAGGPLQARIIEQAKGAPNLASTLNQGAFNLGNALGAGLGGLLLTEGLGYRWLPSASGLVACGALGVALLAVRLERRARRSARAKELRGDFSSGACGFPAPMDELFPAALAPGYLQIVGHRKDTGHRVSPDAGRVLVRFGVDGAIERQVAVLDRAAGWLARIPRVLVQRRKAVDGTERLQPDPVVGRRNRVDLDVVDHILNALCVARDSNRGVRVHRAVGLAAKGHHAPAHTDRDGIKGGCAVADPVVLDGTG